MSETTGRFPIIDEVCLMTVDHKQFFAVLDGNELMYTYTYKAESYLTASDEFQCLGDPLKAWANNVDVARLDGAAGGRDENLVKLVTDAVGPDRVARAGEGRATVLFDEDEKIVGLVLGARTRGMETFYLRAINLEVRGRRLAQWMYESYLTAFKVTGDVSVDLKDCGTRANALPSWGKDGFNIANAKAGEATTITGIALSAEEIRDRRARWYTQGKDAEAEAVAEEAGGVAEAEEIAGGANATNDTEPSGDDADATPEPCIQKVKAAPQPCIRKVKATRKKGRIKYEGQADKAPRVEELSQAWMSTNFSEYQMWWKDLHGELLGQWCIVPAGSAGTPSVDGVSDGGIGEFAPAGVALPVVIYQGTANYCASYAGLASALRHSGYDEHSDHLENEAKKVLATRGNQAAEAIVVVGKYGGFNTHRMPNFDPLADRSPHPTILQLCATDGDNTHVVGIAGDWIFDSNRHHALPLCKESLDACCLGDVTFERSSYAVRLIPGKKLQKRKRV